MFTPHSNRPNNNPIVIPSGSDSDGYSDSELSDMEVDPPSRPQRAGMGSRFDTAPPPMRYRPSQPPYHTSLEQEKKVRSRLREERHAALSVLTDRELLTTQALAAQETLPQTRRRFLSKLMAPEDPAVATSLRADRFIIQHPTTSGIGLSTSSSSAAAAAAAAAGEGGGGGGPSSLTSPRSGPSSTVPMIVQRSIVDVYDADDAGWRRPPEVGAGGSGGGGAGSGGSSGIGSPAGSGPGSSRQKGKGTTRTPDRSMRGVGGGGGGSAGSGTGSGRTKTPGSLRRERERRRRWSGAERERDERERISSP